MPIAGYPPKNRRHCDPQYGPTVGLYIVDINGRFVRVFAAIIRRLRSLGVSSLQTWFVTRSRVVCAREKSVCCLKSGPSPSSQLRCAWSDVTTHNAYPGNVLLDDVPDVRTAGVAAICIICCCKLFTKYYQYRTKLDKGIAKTTGAFFLGHRTYLDFTS